MTKVAIKNREYHFLRWNLHHFFVAFHTSPLVWVGDFMLMQEPRIPENPHINGLQNDDKWAVRGMSMGYVTRCLMRTVCMLLERGCRQEWKAGEQDGERTERKAGRKTWKPQKKCYLCSHGRAQADKTSRE